MWCDHCRADAAAQVSAETGRAVCGTCGADLGMVRRPATDQARELLKRWNAGIDLEDAPESLVAGADGLAGETATSVSAEPRARRVRLRRPPAVELPVAAPATAPAARPVVTATSARTRIDAPHPSRRAVDPDDDFADGFSDGPRYDTPHSGGPAPPHFDVQMAIAARTERGGYGAQIIGQILAYSGVLALTLGTALVIWGYFGGPPDYAPTGWLVATGGQMLLFLGVVTLVAGGLEQTSRDVRVRVESLGERLIRIEQVAAGHTLRGPHGPAAGYAGQQTTPRHSRQRA